MAEFDMDEVHIVRMSLCPVCGKEDVVLIVVEITVLPEQASFMMACNTEADCEGRIFEAHAKAGTNAYEQLTNLTSMQTDN